MLLQDMKNIFQPIFIKKNKGENRNENKKT